MERPAIGHGAALRVGIALLVPVAHAHAEAPEQARRVSAPIAAAQTAAGGWLTP